MFSLIFILFLLKNVKFKKKKKSCIRVECDCILEK